MTADESVFFPYQVKWLMDDYPVKIAEKSRQIGFTFATAAMAALEAAKNGGRHTYYIGYNKAMASEFIADVAYWASVLNLSVADVRDDQQVFVRNKRENSVFIYKVDFASGKSVTALSSQPENLRSKRGNIIIDEAAFHKNLPALTKSALALTMWGGKVLIISTHDGDTNPFAQLINDVRIGKEDARLHKSTFMQAVDQGLYERIALKEGLPTGDEARDAWVKAMYRRYGDDAAEELDVIPSRGSSAYIPVQLIERAMSKECELIRLALPDEFAHMPEYERDIEINRWFAINVEPLLRRLPPNLRHYMGGDFGRTIDKSVFAVLTEEPNMDYTTPVMVELHNVPFESQWLILSSMIPMVPRLQRATLEARGNGEPIAERAAQKFSIVNMVRTTDRYYEMYMPTFKSAFEEARLKIPSHTDVLQDIRSIDVERGIPKIGKDKRRRGTDGLTRHGDSAMALFFAYSGIDLNPSEPVATAVDVPRNAYNIRHRRRR